MAKKDEPYLYYRPGAGDTGEAIEGAADGGPPFLRVPKLTASAHGRPVEWDWAGAFCHVIAMVAKEGGLPEGHGAHARDKDWVREWFGVNKPGPSDRAIYTQVEKIFRAANCVK